MQAILTQQICVEQFNGEIDSFKPNISCEDRNAG